MHPKHGTDTFTDRKGRLRPVTGSLRVSYRYGDGAAIEEYDGVEWFLNMERTDTYHKNELWATICQIEREKQKNVHRRKTD